MNSISFYIAPVLGKIANFLSLAFQIVALKKKTHFYHCTMQLTLKILSIKTNLHIKMGYTSLAISIGLNSLRSRLSDAICWLMLNTKT